jgi:hypothetical protein
MATPTRHRRYVPSVSTARDHSGMQEIGITPRSFSNADLRILDFKILKDRGVSRTYWDI